MGRYGKNVVHDALVQRIVKSNPRARTRGFWDRLVELVVAESGEITLGDYAYKIPDPYALTPSDFRRRYLDVVKQYIRDRIGTLSLPDAFELPDGSMSIVLWEVSNTCSMRRSIEKWEELAVELDGYDPWSISVVTVDAVGTCAAWAHEQERKYTWSVDEPCPIDWTVGCRPHRSRFESIEKALQARIAKIRIGHNVYESDDEEAA